MKHTAIDRLLIEFNQGLNTLFGRPQTTERENPAQQQSNQELSAVESRHAAGLMRVNHSGEVAAQALYQGQALTAKLPEVRESMERAALEENDHLAWCESRLKDLGSHKSLLNPLWYTASFTLGALAGLAGDKWSLGFVAETEHQVVRHLDSHLKSMPAADEKSRSVLEQMREDETHHATAALEAGGIPLPSPVTKAMGLVSKIMTKTSYRI
ncbi:MAG: 2-polyprenyl-3-methyl-6-methoxy-1,4-benzoquinone monooxygenase [Gammaproteobacteria bacterium]|nr:2-polyprenyl-3-methyl-6-methoxy-1,4-benzoquinone monooxygenase [Gammaproteobacteria bacterium]